MDIFVIIICMIDLKTFRKFNRITQQQLADFLGVQQSFICNIEAGKASLPDDKLQNIISNERGWDTSTLTGDVTEADEPATSADIKALQREIELLREQLKAERERCDKYIAIIGRWCH